jgi:decaprenylphospho-beta-D-ribofuranose 2-oxidase
MQRKTQLFSNFSNAIKTTANTIRPDNEAQLKTVFTTHPNIGILARGNGLSYSDCCVNDGGTIVDTTRLNHIISFDPIMGIAVCQGAVTFADLFLIDKHFIPPVLPGTLHATLAGGVANDIHGKNNPHAGSLGHHIEWLELQLGDQLLRCSPSENYELFKATIAGVGLTGVITRIALRLRKASRFVTKETEKFTCFPSLMHYMQNEGIKYDYQVAWLDLLNTPHALLSLATHVAPAGDEKILTTPKRLHTAPKLPLRVITPYFMKQFNRFYYYQAKNETQRLSLWQFNNPLDTVNDWNRVYGKNGALQFQAVFDVADADTTLDALLTIIKLHNASPTLAVLKYFTKPGTGLLSFAQPGFTIAIDFIHNQQARRAVAAMNQLISTLPGKIYLAKDLLLDRKQFTIMYPQHDEFCNILTRYNSLMGSDLGKRLGLGNLR